MRKRYLLLLVTLTFGAALLAVDRYSASWEYSSSERSANEPDYYGDGLISRRFDAQGVAIQTLKAASSAHYPDTRHTEFQQPFIVALDQQSTHWQIRAQSGRLSDGEQRLTLQQDVEIRTLDSQEAVRISTDELHYDIEQQIASTERPVRIDNQRIQITAIGMTLDLKRQRMRFHREVNTQYDPSIQ